MKSKYQCTANLAMYDLVGHHNIASTTQGPSACWLQARRLSGEDRWKGAFELRKHKDKFIFTIESTGGQPLVFVLPKEQASIDFML